jgi:hypothetical protein
MTRTRTRRLIRTILSVLAVDLIIFGGVLTALSLPGWAAVTLTVAVLTAIAAWIAGPGRAFRERPQRTRRDTPPRPAVDWRTEAEVARFMAELSAWEARQRSQQ